MYGAQRTYSLSGSGVVGDPFRDLHDRVNLGMETFHKKITTTRFGKQCGDLSTGCA